MTRCFCNNKQQVLVVNTASPSQKSQEKDSRPTQPEHDLTDRRRPPELSTLLRPGLHVCLCMCIISMMIMTFADDQENLFKLHLQISACNSAHAHTHTQTISCYHNLDPYLIMFAPLNLSPWQQDGASGH